MSIRINQVGSKNPKGLTAKNADKILGIGRKVKSAKKSAKILARVHTTSIEDVLGTGTKSAKESFNVFAKLYGLKMAYVKPETTILSKIGRIFKVVK